MPHLGFSTRRYDDGYGFVELDRLQIHLRASPELDPFANLSAAYVKTVEVDALHERWRSLGLWAVPTIIDGALDAEARRRWQAGEPIGRITALVEDKPWGVREFSLLDLDNNLLRFGRPIR